jgi:hypothetical protein
VDLLRGQERTKRAGVAKSSNQWTQRRHLARSAKQHRAHRQGTEVEAGDGEAHRVALVGRADRVQQRQVVVGGGVAHPAGVALDGAGQEGAVVLPGGPCLDARGAEALKEYLRGGGQVLALELNVDFSAAGISEAGLGGLLLQNTGNGLDGQTVSEILSEANTALGGGGLPAGFTGTLSDLNDLVDQLNQAFDDCQPDTWAQTHLVKP